MLEDYQAKTHGIIGEVQELRLTPEMLMGFVDQRVSLIVS